MTKLALDHVQRHALASHPDGVRVPELVRGKATPHPSLLGEPAELDPNRRPGPWPPASWPVDD